MANPDAALPFPVALLAQPDRGRTLLQRGVWANPSGPGVARVFQAWGVLEGREGNVAVARELFK